MSFLPTRRELASPEFYMAHLDRCEDLAELREPRSTCWLDLPSRTPPSTTHVNPKTCTAEEYAEHFVYPALLPALHRTLELREKLPTRKVFDAVDWLSVDLYRRNDGHPSRVHLEIKDIPYVRPCLEKRRLKPIPLSSFLDRSEAATVIQAYCRGHRARQEPLALEFRRWKLMRRSERRAALKIRTFLLWSLHTRLYPVETPPFHCVDWRTEFANALRPATDGSRSR